MSKVARVVIVTGGGSGMGRAIVERFDQNGDTVYALGRRLDRLEIVAKNHKTVIPLQVDITDPATIAVAIKAIYKKHSIVDVLVNCAGAAGHVEPNLALGEAMKEWNKIVATNLTGTFLMTYACLPLLARPGGRIINITSIAAYMGSSRPGGEAYAAAKAGVDGLTRTLVRQLSPQGITVNTVSPGLVEETDFFGGGPISEDRKMYMLASIPTGRVGKPTDVAGAVFYLASEEASFVTGDILHVNGGQTFAR